MSTFLIVSQVAHFGRSLRVMKRLTYGLGLWFHGARRYPYALRGTMWPSAILSLAASPQGLPSPTRGTVAKAHRPSRIAARRHAKSCEKSLAGDFAGQFPGEPKKVGDHSLEAATCWRRPVCTARISIDVSQYGSASQGSMACRLCSSLRLSLACCVKKPTPSWKWSASRCPAFCRCTLFKSCTSRYAKGCAADPLYRRRPSSVGTFQRLAKASKNRSRSSGKRLRISRRTAIKWRVSFAERFVKVPRAGDRVGPP
mmetsp:Transcript_3958/g.9409  ORF Transcript_3958/g.9409 Transcript_3958/m.9409 type:complete len:256 (-) Transcript_3958:806-1573(-)